MKVDVPGSSLALHIFAETHKSRKHSYGCCGLSSTSADEPFLLFEINVDTFFGLRKWLYRANHLSFLGEKASHSVAIIQESAVLSGEKHHALGNVVFRLNTDDDLNELVTDREHHVQVQSLTDLPFLFILQMHKLYAFPSFFTRYASKLKIVAYV